MSLPNLKLIALFVQKLLGGPKIWKLGHVTPATPTKGRFMGRSVLCVCTKFDADSSIRSKVIRGSQNFEIGSRDPKKIHAPFEP